MRLILAVVNLHGHIGRQRFVRDRIERHAEDVQAILNAIENDDERIERARFLRARFPDGIESELAG